MSRRAVPILSLVVLMLAAAVRLPAAESRELTSAWRDRDVRIDGVDEEWRGLTQPVKGQRFAVGFLNDADALYFCLVTKDSTTIRQISRIGLILWLDPAGGKKKTFGVRFPVSYGPYGQARGGADQSVGEGQRDVEILGPGKKDVRDLENGAGGVIARYRVSDDLLVYEMKIPLRKSEQVPFAIDVDPGAALRVELQTPEWRGPVPMRRGGPMVGIGGRPGGPFYYPGADYAVLKPLDIAADLRLAPAPK